ncbi:MAG TPA: polyphenol oxidase family protein [Euzebyales bacterium]|nr:polyphenol oxidase family protein [Euzebyales bacterium]
MPSTLTGVTRADPSIRFAFSAAPDGNVSLAVGAPDAAARPRLADAVGAAPDDLVFMQQVHDSAVAVVDVDDRGRGLHAHDDSLPSVDALVTTDEGVALVVQVADCVPVLLADPGHAVGAVHAGRGGVTSGVVGAAVTAMAPADPTRLEAVVGPAIGGCCYEVEQELADDVTALVPEAAATTTWGTPSLDLPAAVAAQLAAMGVGTVRRFGGCTRCTPCRWYSHRREPGAGRQAGIVVRGQRHA